MTAIHPFHHVVAVAARQPRIAAASASPARDRPAYARGAWIVATADSPYRPAAVGASRPAAVGASRPAGDRVRRRRP